MSVIIPVEEAQTDLKHLIENLAPGEEIVLTDNQQPHADDVGLVAGGSEDVLVKLAKDAMAPRCGSDVDALNPPEGAVAPVAPLERDAKLADHTPIGLGDEIAALGMIAQHRGDAGA